MEVKVIKGNFHSDNRGTISYNNDFDASEVKRIYTIENRDKSFQRGWQGHNIEQRWFSVVQGRFKISVIKIDDWESPSVNLPVESFILSGKNLEVLHVPPGHVTCIQAMEVQAKLLVMADYLLGEVNDEYRFALEYFNQ